MQQLSNTCWLTELGCQEFIEHENEAVLGVLFCPPPTTGQAIMSYSAICF